MPKAAQSLNGHASAKPQTGLDALLARLTRGTDTMVIGTGDAPADVCGATMAAAVKLVSSIKYLLRNLVPFGMVTGVIAQPGIGKSAWVLYALVRTIVLGCNWFNGMKGPDKPGHVLWCATENDMAITLHRMKLWGIPLEQVILPFADDPLAPVDLTDQSHLDLIEALVCKYRTPLVVIDSLRGGHDGDENSSLMGRVLQVLAGIAERTGAAVVVVHHTRKLMVDEEMTFNSSRGSGAIIAMMRSQIGIDRPDPSSKWCRVRVLKENLGIAPEPFGFLVTDRGLKFGPPPERPRKVTQKDRADEWLKANMVPGRWYGAGELQDKADDDGFSETALRRARNELGIVKPHHVRKVANGWEWRLPVPGEKQQDVQGGRENGNALTS